MTPDGQIATPLDIAANRELDLLQVFSNLSGWTGLSQTSARYVVAREHCP